VLDEVGGQPGPFGVAPDELGQAHGKPGQGRATRRGHGHVGSGHVGHRHRHRHRHWHAAERRVVGEDGGLQRLQPRSRVESELVGQHPPAGLVRGQRLGLAPGPVQGQHQLGPEPLA
jgi:hypothetical protein